MIFGIMSSRGAIHISYPKSKEPPPPFSGASSSLRIADDLLRSIASVRRTSRRHSGRPAEFSTLTDAQLELVRLVARRPGVSIADAAQELRLAPNTVSTLVGQLAAAGIVMRGADALDRRVARLELAPDLRRGVAVWRDRRVVSLGAAIDELPGGDRECLVEALTVLAGTTIIYQTPYLRYIARGG